MEAHLLKMGRLLLKMEAHLSEMTAHLFKMEGLLFKMEAHLFEMEAHLSEMESLLLEMEAHLFKNSRNTCRPMDLNPASRPANALSYNISLSVQTHHPFRGSNTRLAWPKQGPLLAS